MISNQILFLDFDGVFVPNLFRTKNKNINTANISSEEFAKTVQIYDQISRFFLNFFDFLQGLFPNAYTLILTGRKESLLGDFTRELLRKANIVDKINEIAFYPEDKSYQQDVYFDWKTCYIRGIMDKFKKAKAIVLDDDLALLKELRHNTMLPQRQLKFLFFEVSEIPTYTYFWVDRFTKN
jgi:hypothetical protein